MGRKIRDTLFLLCVVFLTVRLYGIGKLNLSVIDKVQPLCQSSKLTSSYYISTEVVSWEVVENEIRTVQPGGRYTPTNCISTWKVAIIVPYRDRESHLKVFLRNIHPFLQQQQLEYGLFVIEMPPSVAFNRGLLLNVGFNESRRLFSYNCFIFHDVDLLPENIRNIYQCSDHPKHMASAIDTRNYTMSYDSYFGGVNAFSKDQFALVNGFPNVYFGWGREDDDLYHRVLNANLTVQRLSYDIGRYKHLGHQREALGEENDELNKTREHRYLTDGLSNLKYQKISYKLRPLYTWILIDIDHTSQKGKKVFYRE